jgi:hypothetical protein
MPTTACCGRGGAAQPRGECGGHCEREHGEDRHRSRHRRDATTEQLRETAAEDGTDTLHHHQPDAVETEDLTALGRVGATDEPLLQRQAGGEPD